MSSMPVPALVRSGACHIAQIPAPKYDGRSSVLGRCSQVDHNGLIEFQDGRSSRRGFELNEDISNRSDQPSSHWVIAC